MTRPQETQDAIKLGLDNFFDDCEQTAQPFFKSIFAQTAG